MSTVVSRSAAVIIFQQLIRGSPPIRVWVARRLVAAGPEKRTGAARCEASATRELDRLPRSMRSNARSKPMGITGPRLAPQSHALGVDDSPMNPLRLLRLNRRSGTAGRRPLPCLEASSSSGSLSAPSKPRPSARSRTSSGPIRASVSLPRTASSSRPLAIDRYRSEHTSRRCAR